MAKSKHNYTVKSLILIACLSLLFLEHNADVKAECISADVSFLENEQDSLVNLGPDTDEEEEDNGDDIPSALSRPTIATRDTLRTYNLIGQRIYGKAKVSRTRTSYNIIIKSGRKVLRR